jgi:hypothetical protein
VERSGIDLAMKMCQRVVSIMKMMDGCITDDA